jgi:SAM-dependent methyltransferase
VLAEPAAAATELVNCRAMRHVSRAILMMAGVAACLLAAPPTSLRATQAPVEPDVEFIPTPPAVVDAMLALAKVTSADVVYDLGSGDGRVVIAAAQRYGARGVGVEIDPDLMARATANAVKAGVADRVRFITGNIFEADVSEATVVTLYLLQSLNERLRPKLVRELKPGTRIVSHVFSMGPEWPPLESLRVQGHPIFLWTTSAR